MDSQLTTYFSSRKSIPMKFIRKSLLSIAVIGVALSAYSATKELRKETYNMLGIFSVVLEHINTQYVEEKSYTDLIESAIKGMLQDLDPHSDFLTEKDYEALEESITGTFGGLGIHILPDKKTGGIIVVSPIDDTPAKQAGIKAGDIILKVDDTYIDSIGYSEAVKKMRGLPDTNVTITVIRDGGTPFDVTLTRAIIKVPSVKVSVKGNNIAYIRLIQFQQNMTKDLHKKIKEIQAKTPIRGYIIDLRNNPGGLLSEAITISDSFLNQGEIVSTRGRDASQDTRYNATKGDITKGAPIVVLINRGSASASEIVSGALKDHKRAILVGERTFGKGSVQSTITLQEKMAIKFTTALYYTPKGISIQKRGVTPDIQVSPVKISEEIDRGNYGEEQFKGALENTQIKTAKDGKNKKDTDKKIKESLNKTDYVLARGLDILETMIWTRGQSGDFSGKKNLFSGEKNLW